MGFIPFRSCLGVTDRETYTIFLNSYFKENTNAKLIIGTTSKIRTVGNEDVNHVLRLILTINNVNIYLNTRKNGNIFRKKYYNELAKNVYNQGDKFEALLFGDKISKLYIIGSLIILDINNFNKKISQFRKEFKKKNIKKSIKEINETIKEAKENINNFLLQWFSEIANDDILDDSWLEDDQGLDVRNIISHIKDDSQCISIGFCGTIHE